MLIGDFEDSVILGFVILCGCPQYPTTLWFGTIAYHTPHNFTLSVQIKSSVTNVSASKTNNKKIER